MLTTIVCNDMGINNRRLKCIGNIPPLTKSTGQVYLLMMENSPIDTQVMTKKTPSSAMQFKIKLLSGNNVVMVESAGYESQLFTPQLIKGKIVFQNIIPKNRCCNAVATQTKTDHLPFGNVRILPSKGYNYGSDNFDMSAPLARSTPASGAAARSIIRNKQEKVPVLLTPQPKRGRPTQVMTSLTPVQVHDKQSSLETSTSPNLPELQPNISDVDRTPLRSAAAAALLNSPNSNVRQRYESAPKSTPGRAPPVRTYSRHRQNSNTGSTASISWSPLHKRKRQTQESSTKPLSPLMKVEVRHRKLIVDQKKTLPIQDKKKQAVSFSKASILSKQVSAKTREQFEALKMTAFDLLTSPGLSHLAEELRQDFKNACFERYPEPVPSYEELADVAPLVHDRQVKALIAKQARLEKNLSKSQIFRLLNE